MSIVDDIVHSIGRDVRLDARQMLLPVVLALAGFLTGVAGMGFLTALGLHHPQPGRGAWTGRTPDRPRIDASGGGPSGPGQKSPFETKSGRRVGEAACGTRNRRSRCCLPDCLHGGICSRPIPRRGKAGLSQVSPKCGQGCRSCVPTGAQGLRRQVNRQCDYDTPI